MTPDRILRCGGGAIRRQTCFPPLRSEIVKDKADGKPWEPKCGDARFGVYRGTSTHISLVADKDDLRPTLFVRDNIETSPNLADFGCNKMYSRSSLIGCEIKKQAKIEFDALIRG